MDSMSAAIEEPEARDSKRAFRFHKSWLVWAGLLALFVVLQVLPIRSGMLKAMMVVAAAGLWVNTIVLLRRRPAIKWSLVGLSALAAAWLIMPGKEPDRIRLQSAYVRSLAAYQGALYVWGGETSLGIDCSGLIRRAMIDAGLSEGFRTLNPGLVREAIALWWQDCSAAELGRGWKGRLQPVSTAPSLNDADYSGLQPGDVAVTQNGLHTLAYLGDNTWIQADPGAWRVIRNRAGDPEISWFKVPVSIHRWTRLAQRG